MDRSHRITSGIGNFDESEEFCWPVDFPSGTRWFKDRESSKALNAAIPGGVRIAPPPPRRAYLRPRPLRMSVHEGSHPVISDVERSRKVIVLAIADALDAACKKVSSQ